MTKFFFDRLDKYMKYKGLTDYKVTVDSGIAVGTIGRQRKINRCLSMESIEKILQVYTDLNAGWLITGVGEMLNSNQSSTESIQTVTDDISFYKGIINKLQDTIANQQKTISALTLIIERNKL